jgi:hypothetical protein
MRKSSAKGKGKAEEQVMEEEPESESESESEEEASEGALTVASCCRVEGQGLRAATVRESNTFTIVACDENGRRQVQGGDTFFVNIRGGGVRLRAVVYDHDDGRYSVSYKPEVSGTYRIGVSLLGEPLRGSPFECVAGTPTPVAEQCIVRGEALTHAVARTQQTFEVIFR